jgi:hypothetical protein
MVPTSRWVRNSVTAKTMPWPSARSAGANSVVKALASASV